MCLPFFVYISAIKTSTHCDFMFHIGEKIREILKTKGRTALWLANEICVSRTHIYKIFDKNNLDMVLLMRISIALNHDFFADISTYLNEKGVISDDIAE